MKKNVRKSSDKKALSKKKKMLKTEEIKSNANIWKSIKSSFNLNEIFSFLNTKQKLDIIIYNKEIQKKLKINIEDYKEISGKYKIGGKNGKGSEYTLKNKKKIN